MFSRTLGAFPARGARIHPVEEAQKARLARNEDLFRQVNEKIDDIAARHGDDAHVYEFFCECSDVDCSERVHLTLPQYAHVREEPARFVVVKGHVLEEIEHVCCLTPTVPLPPAPTAMADRSKKTAR